MVSMGWHIVRAIRPAKALDIIVDAYPGDCDEDDDDEEDILSVPIS
jgi:hypothetical protein